MAVKKISLNPQTVGSWMTYKALTQKEKKDLKNYGRLWEVMAAGNLIPAKSHQARTVNFEYLPKDEKELSGFAQWLDSVFQGSSTFNKSTLKLVIEKKGSSKVTINFKEKKDPKESRDNTPTDMQEKGTTDVFNRVLENNKRYASVQAMKDDGELMKELRKTFTSKGRKHDDKISGWMDTFFNQQDLFFLQKFAPSKWSTFEYNNQDFVHFFSDFIKKVKTAEGASVGKYTTWNPSDIWAVYNKTAVNKEIDESFKLDKDDPKLSKLNNLLINLLDNAQLVGISLKKIEGSNPHMEIMNTDAKSMKLAQVMELNMSDIDLEIDNIVKQELVTTYIKFAKTHTMNINLGDKKKFGNLTFNTQVKGTAAQGGQAPTNLVQKLLHKKGSSREFKNDHGSYPKQEDTLKKWEKKYVFVKQKAGQSWPSWDEFEDYLEDFYKDKKPQIAVSKLMQIDFYYDAFTNYATSRNSADFWISLLHLGMKVGDRFAPHAKIS